MDMEVTFTGSKKVEARFKGFTVQTDQPLSAGGENTALSPFDLFLTSLGTCAGFFVLSFCQSRAISTEGLKLTLDLGRNPQTHMVERVAIDIHVPSGFPEKYREAVVRAAESCTVKKHLQAPPAFEIRTVEA